MQLISSNVNSSNSIVVSDTISLPSQNISNAQLLAITDVADTILSIGSNVTISPTAITVPGSISLGGVNFMPLGPFYGGIVNTQTFTANGTWTNPISNTSLALTGSEQVFMMVWGGGAGGSGSGANQSGGGGGACAIVSLSLNDFTNTCVIKVGLGGASDTTLTQAANGTNSVVVVNATSNVYGFGGCGAFTDNSFEYPGTGAGVLSVGFTSVSNPTRGGLPDSGGGNSSQILDATYGGGGVDKGGTLKGGNSIFGGGGAGCAGNTSSSVGRIGGSSTYGGAGGSVNVAVVSTSIFGGNGANISVSATAPGGGGSAGASRPGARGEVRIWVIK